MVKYIKIHYKRLLLLCSVTVAFYTFCFFVTQYYPFGENTLLVSDLGAQYAPFLNFLTKASLGDLFYSFSKGVGGQTFSLFTYYLLSPFNIVAFFFKPQNIDIAVMVILYLKVIAISITGYMFFYKKDQKLAVVFAVLYTFLPFFGKYFMNIIWIDGFILFPLLLLATEQLIDKGKLKFFIIVYAYSLITCYYITYISSLFIVLYFFYYAIGINGMRLKDIVTKVKAIILAVFTALMLSLFTTLPTFISLTNTKIGSEVDTLAPYLINNFVKVCTNSFAGVLNVQTLPYFFLNAVVFVLVSAYFFNKAIDKKEKIVSALIITFLFLSEIISTLYLMWHAFAEPEGFPFRFQYVIYMFLLILSVKALKNISKTSLFFLVPVAIDIVAFVVIYFNIYTPLNKTSALLMSIILLISTSAIIVLLTKKVDKGAFKILIVLLVFASLYDYLCYFRAHEFAFWMYYNNHAEYSESYNNTEKIISEIDDDGFYRMEELFADTINSFRNCYYSISHFSSAFDTAQNNATKRFGIYTRRVETKYTFSHPLVDSLFGLKYLYIKDDKIANAQSHYELIVQDKYNVSKQDIFKNYKTIMKDDTQQVYQNIYALPILFTAPTKGVTVSQDPFEYISNMFLALTDYTVYDKTTGEVNHENLKKASSLLQNNGLELTSQKGNKITATTSLQKAETIYTSIPYDTSWRIYVNGQKVQPKPFMQSFISFDVPKGEAEIYMVYYPKMLFVGLVFSITTLIIVVLVAMFKTKKLANNNETAK